MRPALKSGLLPVWRDRDTLQIGIDPRRAIALSGIGQAALVIGLLDGSRDRGQVVTAAASRGVPATVTERILTLLAAGGALDDFPASTLRTIPTASRARLAAELATSSLAYRDPDGGARSLARRRDVAVWITGERRISRSVAKILLASGVAQVRIGEAQQHRPDLAVLVGRPPLDLQAALAAEGMPHLAVLASEAIGVVGPLVIPGRTACLRCLDYVRAGYDPAWPLILAQISTRRPDPPACDAVLTASVAAQTAAQVLTAIDKTPAASATVNGTLELVLPDWRWRRRTWRPHPACSCSSHTGR
jgi:bacteriocin biosynthesis cyclodehydratase domain-containing protein